MSFFEGCFGGRSKMDRIRLPTSFETVILWGMRSFILCLLRSSRIGSCDPLLRNYCHQPLSFPRVRWSGRPELTAGRDARRARHLHSGVTRQGEAWFRLALQMPPTLFLYSATSSRNIKTQSAIFPDSLASDVEQSSIILALAFKCNNSLHQLFIC